ncbi:methyltransferase domain-containing protein [Candidatus Woesearchaeota archaeon]|nr:MAG: methyltransferase domain-containing protein [Candidatus Woesearchaeota archaeon]
MYEPREDSFLLRKHVERIAKGEVLDVGTGSGILAEAASRNAEWVLATDISLSSLFFAKKGGVRAKNIAFLCSDLFSSIQNVLFDVIIFNPPYLPNDNNVRDIALDGGAEGYELIERFLKKAKFFLKSNGIILIVFSSLTKKDKVDWVIRREGYCYELLDKKKLDFEELYVYKINYLY